MDDEPKKRGCLKKLGISLLVLLVLLAGYIWWRQGELEVQVDEAKLATLPKLEAGAPVEFSACTYNVQARPWFDEAVPKFKYISPLLNNHDIIGIQECFKQHELLFAAAEHPVKVYHGSFIHPFKIVGSGLAILGRFPLVETADIHFSDAGDFQNWPAAKGVVMARFNLNGMLLDVYTTHFAAGGKPDTYRAKPIQGDELIAFVRKQSPPENSVIVMGDFNMRPSRSPEDKEENRNNPKVFVFDKIVAELGLRDASDEINGPVGEEIDRVLFRPGTGQTMETLSWTHDTPEYYFPPDGKAPLSDHEPVIVRFKLGKA